MNLGYLPDPPKTDGVADFSADLLLSTSTATTPTIPLRHSNNYLIVNVLNQGNLGSCVAQSVVQALRASMVLQLFQAGMSLEDAHAKAELASRLYLYYLARSTHGSQTLDSGTWLRAIFEVINRFGFPSEDLWAYDDTKEMDTAGNLPKFARLPSHKAFQAGYDQRSAAPGNKLIEYHRIYDGGYARVDVFKKLLHQGYNISFGTIVGNDYWNQAKSGKAIDPPSPSEERGGHAQLITGFDGDDFDVLNSWGPEFGVEGYALFSADYIAWDKTAAGDAWAVKRAPMLEMT